MEKASVEDSKRVVEICTQYAQRGGMFNIFLAVFFSTLAFACFEPYFFIGYLISIALFGLFQALFMANAGGAWDNAKKVVETELKERHRPARRHVVGDTVGDPFKDTSSVAMNPVIKFTTLFGLLAVDLALAWAAMWHASSPAAAWWWRCSSSTGRSTACASRATLRRRRRSFPALGCFPASLLSPSFPKALSRLPKRRRLPARAAPCRDSSVRSEAECWLRGMLGAVKPSEFERAVLELAMTTRVPLTRANILFYSGVSAKQAEKWLDEMLGNGLLEFDSDDSREIFYTVCGAKRPPGGATQLTRCSACRQTTGAGRAAPAAVSCSTSLRALRSDIERRARRSIWCGAAAVAFERRQRRRQERRCGRAAQVARTDGLVLCRAAARGEHSDRGIHVGLLAHPAPDPLPLMTLILPASALVGAAYA